MRPRILAAVRPQGAVAVKRALGQYAEVVPVFSYDEATAALRAEKNLDLVLCGMFFDETRAFDLLRHVKRDFPALPVICCRIGDREVQPVALEATGIAAKGMGAAAFIDMPLLHADPATDAEFRSVVLRYAHK